MLASRALKSIPGGFLFASKCVCVKPQGYNCSDKCETLLPPPMRYERVRTVNYKALDDDVNG